MTITNTVHILGFTRNPEAMKRTCAEVERVGFRADPYWNVPSPYIDFLVRKMPCHWMIEKNHGFLSCTLGHYSIWKTFRELGEPSIFVCEDDCRFLKDKEMVHEALANHPQDADILLLDTLFPEKGGEPVKVNYLAERAKASNGWARVSRARSMCCYIINKSMADRLIYLNESGIRREKQLICDQWLDTKYMGNLKIYSAVPNLAIQQRPPEDVKRNSGIQNWKYGVQGTEESQYGEW